MRSRLCDLPKMSLQPPTPEADSSLAGNLTENMPRRQRISDIVKGQMLAFHEQGFSNRQIARRLRISEGSVRYNLLKHVKGISMIEGRHAGRPRKTTRRDDFAIRRYAVRSRTDSCRALANKLAEVSGTQVSDRTIRRRLAEKGIHRRVAKRKPWLSNQHREARLQWAKNHAHFTSSDWERVLWTDECKFTVFDSSRRRIYVSRRSGEEYLQECLRPTVKHGGKSLMVWGCFGAAGVGELRQIHGIMDSFAYMRIVRDAGLSSAIALAGPGYIYQQDNDPKHTSKTLQKFFSSAGVHVMRWPSQSPDLNPIEHLWDDLKRRLRSQPSRPTTADGLFAELKRLWNCTSSETTRTLVASMPRRVQEVLINKGGATSF